MFIPKALLFDLDGLLLDTEPLHGEAWAKAAKTFGKSLSKEQLLMLRGRRRLDCAKQIEAWINKPIGADNLISIQQPIAKKLLQKAKPMPGAKDLVTWCYSKRFPMALVTSSSAESVAFKTASHKWLGQITLRIFGDDKDLRAGKPSPDPYILASKRLNVDPKKCWAFEDSLAGTQAALAAGCKVWVLKGESESTNNLKSNSSNNPQYIKNLNEVLISLKQNFPLETNQ